MYYNHQQGKGRVWPQWLGFHGTGWNVDITNEISVLTGKYLNVSTCVRMYGKLM